MSTELYGLWEELRGMKDCKEKVGLAETVANLALKEKHYAYEFYSLFELSFNSHFNDDGYKAILYFPRFIDIANNKAGEVAKFINSTEKSVQRDFIYIESLILSSINDYYQIKNEKYNEVLEDIKSRCIKYGYSLRLYYSYLLEDCMEDKDKVGARENYNKFIKEKRDKTSECRGCELVAEIRYKLFVEEIVDIQALLDKIFHEDINGCDNSKCLAIGEILRYSLKNKVEFDIDIPKYIKGANRYIKGVGQYMPTLIMYYSTKDIGKGVSLFTKYVGEINKSKNPFDKCYFYGAVKILFEVMKLKGDKSEVKLLLPTQLSYYKEDGLYNIDMLIEKSSEFFTENRGSFEQSKDINRFEEMNEIRKGILETL